MPPPVIHLVCNAHLDPVWQWEWEEGVCEAISTFRAAADLCEAFEGFVFNHNEVILYQWIEAYSPELFQRIQQLVKAGKWHIMGGWYLQPDCNMPSGEGLVRQILAGREYFLEKFSARPTTAINFDPFGHSRGLVQILAKSGYDSYIHCRPSLQQCGQPANEYVWVGYDGSEILCTRPRLHAYNSSLGQAGKKLETQMEVVPELGVALLLWGVGNHGGGPSRKDIRDINRMVEREKANWTIRHSTPEAYFEDLKPRRAELVRWEHDLNPWAVGCYTSMVRIKQGYRALENALLMVEKMASTAAVQGLMPYPRAELKAAQEDLLWTAFHDVLPGSSTAPVEQHSLCKIGHGMELLSRIRARAFFCLSGGQPKARPGTFPVFVFNPHPWAVETDVVAEFNLPDIIFCPDTFWLPSLTHKGKSVAVQAERPHSNMPMDWRKRVCFRATLAPGVMNRYDITLTRLPARPAFETVATNGVIRVRGSHLDWAISTRSGLVDHLRVNGKDMLRKGAFKALVMSDTPDPWGMTDLTFASEVGRFRLLSQVRSAEVSGLSAKRCPSVRVIEDGPVRTVVEALYGFHDSILILTWKVPKTGSEIELEARVLWNEKDRMLKLCVPTVCREPEYMGEVAYGRDALPATGREVVAQKWTAVVSKRDDAALTMVNDGTYGSSFANGEMRLTLLRSPAYTAHPVGDWRIVPEGMFRPRMDQGERLFTFWMNAGAVGERLEAVAREAQVHNERVMTQWFSPSGEGRRPKPFIELSNNRVQMTALKQAEDGKGWIIRLFEPTGQEQRVRLRVAVGRRPTSMLTLKPFEIKSLRVDPELGTIIETNLVEEAATDGPNDSAARYLNP